MRTDTSEMTPEYRDYFELGAKAGKDAQRVMTESDLTVTRIRVTRIAAALETAWYDAAYARGFLKATDPIPQVEWHRQPGVRRRRREWR